MTQAIVTSSSSCLIHTCGMRLFVVIFQEIQTFIRMLVTRTQKYIHVLSFIFHSAFLCQLHAYYYCCTHQYRCQKKKNVSFVMYCLRLSAVVFQEMVINCLNFTLFVGSQSFISLYIYQVSCTVLPYCVIQSKHVYIHVYSQSMYTRII